MFRYIVAVYLSVIVSCSEFPKYRGCYWENKDSKRLMPDGHKDFPKGLTNEACFDFCRTQKASLAGLQYGRECFCSNTGITQMFLSNDTNCNVKCNGNRWQKCGGRHHLSVFDLDGSLVNDHKDKYVGCFEDFSDYRMLPDRMWKFPKILTPDLCIGHCWRNGYNFAGLLEGDTCFCGDAFNEDFRRDESECSMPCSGDDRYKCGAETNMDVYSIGIEDISEEGKEIGCFEDEEVLTSFYVKLLPSFELILTDTNTPKKCLNLCSSLGYTYSGVTYGRRCNCGNKKPISTLLKPETECSIPCPGDENKFCGGIWRIMVYKMGHVADLYDIRGTESTPVTIPTSLPQSECVKSRTTVNGVPVCKGSVIFSDDFDNDNSEIDKAKWSHSIYMPWIPDYDFVVFNNKANNSFTKSGKLIIKPTVMDEDFIRNGKLSLSGCTGETFTQECERAAISYAILPPVESAKLTTRESFSFKYGRVDIKAKLPTGDWLYPEIYLEPTQQLYGKGYESGKIMLAASRGNSKLFHRGKDVGGTLLEEGVMLGNSDGIKGRTISREANVPWSSTFHTYSVIWSPENIWFMIDGNTQQALMPSNGSKLYELLNFQNPSASWARSQIPVAPFDQESFISIGLTVGGLTKFPDNSVSGDYRKPWNNKAIKAMASFLQAKENWIKTWKENSATLQIDSVTVTAL